MHTLIWLLRAADAALLLYGLGPYIRVNIYMHRNRSARLRALYKDRQHPMHKDAVKLARCYGIIAILGLLFALHALYLKVK